jgi:cell division protein FtsI/penicillin-binding protein 2
MHHHRLAPWLLAVPVAVLALVALAPAPDASARERSAPDPARAATVASAPAAAAATAALGPMRLDPDTGAWVAPIGGAKAVLTLDPRLQERLGKYLAAHRVPWGAAVLLEPESGRVLALAEHSRAEPGAQGLAFRALAPAASIFKIVTSAALLQHGVEKDSEICFHGGRRRLAPRLLLDDPRRDRRCSSLSEALGHSTNVVFAKLAGRGLSPDALRAEAGRFLFNAAIPFSWPVEVSRADIPEDSFRLAETAAGFGPVRMSPLHGALIAGIVANGGVLVPPRIVESVDGAAPPPAGPSEPVLSPEVAASLAEMMRTTVTEGTARRAFRQDRWSKRSPLHGVSVAGKTGSLADRDPYRDYSWFVGFAPVERPRVAVAAVVVNERLWHVKATQVAREALAAYFAEHGREEPQRTAAR